MLLPGGIVCDVASGTPGASGFIVVTTTSGGASTGTEPFSFYSLPSIASVDPSEGPQAGMWLDFFVVMVARSIEQGLLTILLPPPAVRWNSRDDFRCESRSGHGRRQCRRGRFAVHHRVTQCWRRHADLHHNCARTRRLGFDCCNHGQRRLVKPAVYLCLSHDPVDCECDPHRGSHRRRRPDHRFGGFA